MKFRLPAVPNPVKNAVSRADLTRLIIFAPLLCIAQ